MKKNFAFKKRFALAALASCLSFGASAQSFFDSFNGVTNLSQWSFVAPTGVVDTAFNTDDYLFVATPTLFTPGTGATFSFTAATALTSVRLSGLYAGDGGTIQFSHGSVNRSFSLGPFGLMTDNPGPLGTSFSTEFFSTIPQGAQINLRFQGVGLGMNIDDVRITAVPEPGTYALMLAGLGVMGFVARRRQSARAEALLPNA